MLVCIEMKFAPEHAETDSSLPVSLNRNTLAWTSGRLSRQHRNSFHFCPFTTAQHRPASGRLGLRRGGKNLREALHWEKCVDGRMWSTSEGKSERSEWIRGQHENRFLCLCSWLVQRRLILHPELGLHKSEVCKQDSLSSTSTTTKARACKHSSIF